MSYVLTFVVADVLGKPLNSPMLRTWVRGVGAVICDDPDAFLWLKAAVAADVQITAPLSQAQMHDLQDILEPQKIDVFCVPAKQRRKKLLLADMDATMVEGETLDELAAFAGVKDQVQDITTQAMNGALDFHEALQARVALIKGLKESALQENARQIRITAGAKELVQSMKLTGAPCVLVTGGFTYFADEIGAKIGFDHVHGNVLEMINGALSGQVIPPVLDKHSKLAYLQEYSAKYNIPAADIMAIGDGANDLPMLQAAGFGVGYHPKPIVRQALLNCILHGDLSSALYAQGYRL